MSSNLPVCNFDPNCYRKNPQHFQQYSHPQQDALKKQKQQQQQQQAQQPPPKPATPQKQQPQPQPHHDPPSNTLQNQNQQPQQNQQQASPKKSFSTATSPLGSPASKLGGSPSKHGGGSGHLSYPRPDTRPSPLKGSKDPQEVFEMSFPKDEMKMIIDAAETVINKVGDAFQQKNPLRAYPGIVLVGPFEVMHQGANFESDRRKWMHHRRPLHPPEGQTFAYVEPSVFKNAFGIDALAKSGNNNSAVVRRDRDDDATNNNNTSSDILSTWPTLCFFRDDPADSPFIVASYGRGGRELKPLHKSISRVLCHMLRLYITQTPQQPLFQFNPQTTMLLARQLIQSTLKDKISDLPNISKELSSFDRERQKKVVAKTLSGVGIVVPYDKEADIGYRPPHLTRYQLSQMMVKMNDGTNSSKDQSELDEQLRWADIANDESDFGMGLEIGLNFFHHSKMDATGSRILNGYVFSNCVRMLDICYSLLGREVFQHILACQAYTYRSSK